MNQPNPLDHIAAGQQFETVQFSLPVGGLMATWDSQNHHQLWAIDSRAIMPHLANGAIARTLQDPHIYREVGLLDKQTNTFLLPARLQKSANQDTIASNAIPFQLQPATQPTDTIMSDLKQLLAQGCAYAIETNSSLIVSQGGWQSDPEPYCIFMANQPDQKHIIETKPLPTGSEYWQRHIQNQDLDQSVLRISGPIHLDTPQVAANIIIEAMAAWKGLDPWRMTTSFLQPPTIDIAKPINQTIN